MFSSLTPYSEYTRPIDWLPPVPSHWSRTRFRNLLSEVEQRSTTGAEQLLRVSQYTGVTERRSANGGVDTRAASLVGYKAVQPNDLAVNIMLAWNGSLGVSRFAGIVSPAYCVYRFRQEANPWYFHTLLRSDEYKARIKALSTGVVESRLRLYTDDFYGLDAPVPPAEEQAAIVRYLGHAHARIDKAIASKRKLIALLEEQKQAIIHQAVTRGLDPNVPLKDSGIPWLGEIPAKWGLLLAQHLFRPVWRSVVDSQLPQMSLTRSRGLVESGAEGSNTQAAESASNLQTCRRGDFVLNKYRAHLGLFRSCRIDGLVTRNYTVLAPTGRVHNSYFELLFLDPVFASGLQTMSRGVGDGMSPLYTATLLGMKMPVPSLEEQRQIAFHVAKQVEALETIADRTRREIELLREFRARLTSDVVTGQVDVRGIAATLPELTDEFLATEGDFEEDSLEDIAEEFLEGESD